MTFQYLKLAIPCILPLSVSKVEEKKNEDTQRRESDSEEIEDMAREERQGQVTLPSQPAASQSAASQHSSEPSASYLGLLKKLKRQEKI